MSDFQPSGIINDRPRPRILLWLRSDDSLSDFDWVEARSATFRHIHNLTEVDLSEWDVLVTNEPFAWIQSGQWGLIHTAWGRVPAHLYIFRTFGPSAGRGRGFFDFNLDEEGRADDDRALRLGSNIAGHNMVRVNALPEPIQDLVKSDLLPIVEARDKQFGVLKTADELAPGVINLRPFLFGPSGVILAASYERPAGKPVWLLPSDVPNPAAWFDVAITEWHISDARTFPDVVTWQTDRYWDTDAESEARDALEAIEAEFAARASEYETARAAAKQQLDDVAALATTGPKSLLTAQDEPLQTAVYEALTQLGFEVEDMDQTWPERERREDFRVRDGEDADWLVIADATGVAKGAPGSKITTVVGYVTKYVLEEAPPSAPGVWIIVNRLFSRDPMSRGDVYRPDDLAVLEAQSGLAIDSAALYLLSQSIEEGSDRARNCRAWLRTRRGQVTAADAVDWLSGN